MKIALAQINRLAGDIAGDAQRELEAARHARDAQGAPAVVFPELTPTGYPPENLLLRNEMAERVQQAQDRRCAEAAADKFAALEAAGVATVRSPAEMGSGIKELAG